MLPETFEEKLEKEFNLGREDAEAGREKYISFSYPSHLELKNGVVSKFREAYEDGYEHGKSLRNMTKRKLNLKKSVTMQVLTK